MIKQTVSFSKNAANVFFHLLTECNLKCRHCYINPDQHGRKILPLPVIESWLEVLAQKKQTANVIFLGGEPTLHPNLAEAIKAANKLKYKSITIDTNGYLFHDILNKVSPEEVDFFSFSLDGPDPETNDPLRGKGVFEICTAGIRKAVKKGFGTSLIYTVSSANLHKLDKMPALLKDLGVDRFFIQVIGIRGNSAQKGETRQVTKDKWLSVVPKVAEKVAEMGITVTWPKVFLESGDLFECAGLCADNYFIFPNGRVYRCPLCEDFPMHALEFNENRIIERPKLNEADFFHLSIPEGCVMNKLVQPDNLTYDQNGIPKYQVACCMLKQEIQPN